MFAPTYWDPTSGKRSSDITRYTADQLQSIKEFVETLIVKATLIKIRSVMIERSDKYRATIFATNESIYASMLLSTP